MASTPKHARSRGRRTVLVVALVALVAIAAAGAVYLVWQQSMISRAVDRAEGDALPAPASGAAETELAQNPIDFASLWQENSDAYAWLSIPGAQISLPILQSPTDDEYYLTHDRDRQDSPVGAVFTQMANAKDFSNPVTVIYGHDVDGLLKTLHDFEDPDFFASNPEMTIYLPGRVLTYTIVSAYKYDDRHILNSFDFSDPAVRESYFSFVANPESMLRNVREGVELNADSKIVQLSTCMLNEYHGTSRYIVTGVLTDEHASN